MRHVQLLKKTGIQKYGAKNKLKLIDIKNNHYPPQKVNKLEEKNRRKQGKFSEPCALTVFTKVCPLRKTALLFLQGAMIKLSLGYLTNVTLSGYYDIC